MHFDRICGLAAISLLALGSLNAPALANRVANPGFEDPITYDGAPFVGFWEGFIGSVNAVALNAAESPRSGAQHLRLEIVLHGNDFAGALQDIPDIAPGEVYVFSGWHRTPSAPLLAGVEIRIEWRDSASGMEISRTPNISPVPTDAYGEFTLTATAPAGADTARLVYAIETFSTGPSGDGIVDVDDVVFIREGETAAVQATWSRVKTLYR